jgi:SAM-dependent methyltransferase
MAPENAIRDFYEKNPRMVSSPFGGVDGIQEIFLLDILCRLKISLVGKRVLDVGCGRAFAGEVVRRQGGTYTGCDFVISGAEHPIVQGDAARLPFADASFDVLFCIDASEHFPEPAKAANELCRVLKPGGVFFLSAPNYGNVAGAVKWACETFGDYEKNSWAPFGRWQPQECEQALTPTWIRNLYRKAGFRRFKSIGHGGEVYLGLFPWTDHPKMPEALQFRLQHLFRIIGPPLVALFPRTSLHLFWRMEKKD